MKKKTGVCTCILNKGLNKDVRLLRNCLLYLSLKKKTTTKTNKKTKTTINKQFTVLPAKSDSDVIFCLQHYQGLIIVRSLVY